MKETKVCQIPVIGSLSNDEGGGCENVTYEVQNYTRLFHRVQFVKFWYISLELNSKAPYANSEKGIEIRCLVLTSSTEREIKKFHVVYLQRRQRNVQKSVMNMQSCCFANFAHCVVVVFVVVAVVFA